jgi:hypothetical protein
MRKQTFYAQFNDATALSDHQLKGLQLDASARLRGLQFLSGAPGERPGFALDAIQHLDDLKRLPFTTADDLRDFYPFPLRSVPFEQIVRVSTPVQEPPESEKSSGTPRRTWTTGFTFSPAATRWPASPRWTACRSLWAMASGQPAWDFNWAVKRWAPWLSRWVRAIWTCISSSWRICARPFSAVRRPWPCSGRRDPPARHRRQDQHSQNHLRIRAHLTIHARQDR